MKTRTVQALAVAALVAGCAQTPADLRETGTRASYASTNAPARVADCMARNAENNNMQARLRPADNGGTEVMAYTTLDGALNAQVIAELTPASTGTRAAVFISRNVMDKEKMQAALLKGC